MIYYLIENDLDQMNPEDPRTENMEDDEARVFHVRGVLLIQLLIHFFVLI